MKIQLRLSLLTISVTLVALVAVLFISSYLSREALVHDAKEKLLAIQQARYSALETYIDSIHRNLDVLADAPSTARSLHVLTEAYAKLGKNAQTLLQYNYPFESNAQKMARPTTLLGSDYDRAHSTANAFLIRRHEDYGWYDMFLIDPQGNVVFTIEKKSDFATNLLTGPWKDTGLARAVTPLLHDAAHGVMSFSDFSHYAPDDNKPASFVAMPVFDPEKQAFLGVVAIQLPIEQIDKLMQDKTGMGNSGETFVAGKDGWMLSDSRFSKESTALTRQLKATAITRVLNGESGLELYPDYRGIDVFVAFKPFKPFGDDAALGEHPRWGVMAKIDKDEVYAKFYELRMSLLLSGTILTLLALVTGFLGARGISRPLIQIKDALARLSRGELVEIPHLERQDEIGEMAKAAEAFREVAQLVEHEHWMSENVTELTNTVSNENSVGKAADKVLQLLCEKLAVPVGAIYLLDKGCYQRIGAHGLARRSQAEDGFKLGEGLLGQCAKDNQALVLSPVPAGLSIISTGLAEFPPHELILYPITHKHEVLALLELASAKSLNPNQHAFLKEATATLGLHLVNLQAAEHNLELLVETRKQSVELKAQQDSLLKSNEEMHAMTKEMRTQAEEMKAQNEELKASQEELRAQQDEMKDNNQLLETQSAQLEEVLAEARGKADDLQRANQYKSEFLANMSHELRTPLNSVLILSKNLAKNEEDNLSLEQVECATVIAESGNQLLTLINDILDLSRIEAGKLKLVSETFQLDDMLAYLRRIFSPQADSKNLAFYIQVATDLPEAIHSDRQRLTQILTNMLSNAIKFTDSGEVRVSVSKDHDDLLFDVVDSGIGISADKLEHIFGAFQQVDGSTSRKYGGSGLGLAISRHLAELLGGNISVSSEQGKGSHFCIRLLNQFGASSSKVQPAVNSASSLPYAASAPVEISKGGCILVVEDDTRLLSILGRMIHALGFRAVCVESAEQALVAIAKESPIGILLDMGLPKMSGMELLHRLKGDKTSTHIPVFIMSGAVDSGEAKVLGALGLLKKPVTRDTIFTAIKTMVGAEGASGVKRVLLVDGDASEIKAICKLFRKDELELIPANSGSDALQLLNAHQYDAVILDLQLPDMTGFNWLKQACTYLNPPPAVIYSAHELSEKEVFDLKEVTESIVTKGAPNDRLREEVLLALDLGQRSSKIAKLTNSALASGKKLLLVDDDARNLFALTKVLRASGYAVAVAADAGKAMQMLNLNVYDAVLTDIMMPEMDGYALIRQIRALGYADLPIIAITAKAMQGDDVLCMEAGATAYFAKPVDMDKLIELLKRVLGNIGKDLV